MELRQTLYVVCGTQYRTLNELKFYRGEAYVGTTATSKGSQQRLFEHKNYSDTHGILFEKWLQENSAHVVYEREYYHLSSEPENPTPEESQMMRELLISGCTLLNSNM